MERMSRSRIADALAWLILMVVLLACGTAAAPPENDPAGTVVVAQEAAPASEREEATETPASGAIPPDWARSNQYAINVGAKRYPRVISTAVQFKDVVSATGQDGARGGRGVAQASSVSLTVPAPHTKPGGKVWLYTRDPLS